ncbi:type II toxin-antitoxin system HipA family toxin [Dyella sp. 2RAB6]|uniref:type II toxin-antitoxin system HipA family toxin n=1 Tax=Dyella sp. 2RAB6 TaxID=3232992 RepID=UPI003F936305
MNELDVRLDDATLGGSALVGHLQRSINRGRQVIDFEYAEDWIAGTGDIGPFDLDHQLIVGPGRLYARAGAHRLAPAFQDASPDRWGCMLIERRERIRARQRAEAPRPLSDWDYLAGVSDETRMGALRLFSPDQQQFVDNDRLQAPPMTDLRELEAITAEVERNDDDDTPERIEWLLHLAAPGSGLGGARPKASIRDVDGSLWLAKFPSNNDRQDIGLWEFIAYRLACAAGVDMPEARVMRFSERGHTYLVRRFDRHAATRRAYASALTLTDREDSEDSEGASYLDIVQAIENNGVAHRIGADLEQLYRRVLFTILIGNRNDHLRNHGFLREGNGWRLSPAFDINPNPEKDAHVLAIDEVDPTPDSTLWKHSAEFYRVPGKRLATIEREVREAVAAWPEVARHAGATRGEIARMSTVIDAAR